MDSKAHSRSGTSRLSNQKLVQLVIDDNWVSNDLRDHLEDLCFTWQNPWYPIVDQSLYQESERTNGRYFNPVLQKSIFAMGARFSDRMEVRSHKNDPKTAGKHFLDEVDVWLYHELKWPSITTLQSLAILASVYIVS